MKNNYINTLTFLILTLYTSISFSQEIQIFELDTIYEKEIIGKHGTKFYFLKDQFEVEEDSKINIKLIEYSRLDKIDSINLNIYGDSKKIGLKKNHFLHIKLNNHRVYNSSKKNNQITWKDITNQTVIVEQHLGGGIYVQKTISKDSLASFNEKQKKELKESELQTKLHNNLLIGYFELKVRKFEEIHLSTVNRLKDKIDITLKNNQNIKLLNYYLVYNNLEAFCLNDINNDSLTFKGLPIHKNTYLIVLGSSKNKQVYYDKVILNASKNQSEIILNMKKGTSSILKNLFKK